MSYFRKTIFTGRNFRRQCSCIKFRKVKKIKILKNHTAQAFNIRYSLETNCIYTSFGDGNFAICSLDTIDLIKIRKLCVEKVRNIDFNYTTSEIAIDSADYTIRIFDIKTLQEKKNFVGHKISSNTVHFSTDGKSLLTGGRDGYLNIWQVGNYKIIKSIPANEWAIYDIAYSHNSNLFATARRYK